MSTLGASGVRGLPPRRALVDDVYDAVLALLIDGVIEPGSKASIDGIARELAVSPTPVREALTRLEAEGLVQKQALKGYLVVPLLRRRDLDDLYDMRRLLEPEAARRAASEISREALLDLERSIRNMRAAGAPGDQGHLGDHRRFMEEDLAFHRMIATGSANALLCAAIIDLRAHLHLYRLGIQHDYAADTVSEHDRILDALSSRDDRGAEVAMRRHLDQSYLRMTEALARRLPRERTPRSD